MRPNNFQALSASAAANTTGVVIDTQSVYTLSAIAVVTGTSTGTLNIEVSNDIANGVDSNGNPTVTNWVVPTGMTVAVSGANTYLIAPTTALYCYRWARVQFVAGNGATGTIAVNVKTKA
jgi:hypothetical protein